MTTASLPQPHRRQFIIGTSAVFPITNWQSYRLGCQRWLSYCPDLAIARTTDIDGVVWVLLGLAIHTKKNVTPATEIATLTTAEVIDNYANWTGRWLLIGNGQIHLDANGLLGCLYGQNSPGEIWISSSSALLAEILETDFKDDRILEYGKGISWYAPPYSGFKAIKRLLASQILNITSGEITSRPLMPEINLSRDYTTTLDLVESALVIALQNLGKQQQPIWLGLTAGYDSRLMLALAIKAGIQFKTFTRVAGRMSVADRLISPKLAKQCGVSHILLRNKPPKTRKQRKQLVAQHSAENVSAGDAEPFIMGVRDGLTGISFGGHGFAIASGFHTLRQLPADFTSPEAGARQIGELFNEPLNSSAIAGMEEWLTWVRKFPQTNLDWRDRFFLEQRQAGWLSGKEQIYDLSDLRRFPILNSARIYSLLLSIPENNRLGSLVQVALLQQIAPELLQYPFNPPDEYFNRWLKTFVKTRDNPQYLRDLLRYKLIHLKMPVSND